MLQGKRAEAGTPKYLANKMKAKGLQRLRWYCQVCEKQCRDENGFKCHTQSEGHLRQMLVVGENAGKHIHDYSMQFQSEFVSLLSRTCGTQRVKANNIYQEYIRDKSHLHMNATRWVTLTGFISHLGQAGIVRVEDTEKGLFISWIDNSPKALAKAEAHMKKDRLNRSDEQRERQMINEQIERAAALNAQESDDDEGDADSDGNQASALAAPMELIRNEGEKVKLSFSFKKPIVAPPPEASTGPATSVSPSEPTTESKQIDSSVANSDLSSDVKPSEDVSAAPVSIKPVAPTNVFKANVFKSTIKTSNPTSNVFKSGTSTNPFKSAQGSTTAASSAVAGPSAGTKRPMSATELLMYEDMERKRRRMDREGIRA
ncbi:hypothetical protein FRC17_002982 [Serendipita sp. 399]|nr:hypothetical protein FRC17_002982 [Serendipita sp. 399]